MNLLENLKTSGECKALPAPKKVKYQVEIVETLRKVVTVEMPLGCHREARDKVMDQYHDCEIILTADDFFDVEINLVDIPT